MYEIVLFGYKLQQMYGRFSYLLQLYKLSACKKTKLATGFQSIDQLSASV